MASVGPAALRQPSGFRPGARGWYMECALRRGPRGARSAGTPGPAGVSMSSTGISVARSAPAAAWAWR